MNEHLRAEISAAIGRELGAMGLRVERTDIPETPESRLTRWRTHFALRVEAEEGDRRAAMGARVKNRWWLRFLNQDIRRRERKAESNVVNLRRSA